MTCAGGSWERMRQDVMQDRRSLWVILLITSGLLPPTHDA